jgi:multicomponent Na+:H+ antiporter subunit D
MRSRIKSGMAEAAERPSPRAGMIDDLASAVVLLPVAAVGPAVLAVLAMALGRRAVPQLPLLALAILAPAAAWLAAVVWRWGEVEVALGGWQAPLGIVLRLDGLSAAFLLMTALVAGAVTLYALAEYRHPAGGESRAAYGFWPLVLFLWSGLNTAFLSRDLFNLYVALEVTSLSGVALVALHGGASGLVAQMRYLLFATLGSLLYLMGVAILYAETGALDLAAVADRLQAGPPATAALVLTTLGLLLKTAIWPLHVWLPAAHASAPAPVSALLSSLVVKASLYLLLRLWLELFAPILDDLAWMLPGLLGSAAVLWGSALAMRQERLKLMIAYSTVAQLGYMLFALPFVTAGPAQAAAAWTGTMLHILSHGIAKAAMFLAAGAILAALGSDDRAKLAGASRLVPVPLFALAIAGLTVMALPPSGGFLGKWLLLRASIGAGQWWLAGVLVLGGLMAAAYLFRFLVPAFRTAPQGASDRPLATGIMGGAAMTLALASMLLGLAAAPLVRLIEPAMPAIVGGG